MGTAQEFFNGMGQISDGKSLTCISYSVLCCSDFGVDMTVAGLLHFATWQALSSELVSSSLIWLILACNLPKPTLMCAHVICGSWTLSNAWLNIFLHCSSGWVKLVWAISILTNVENCCPTMFTNTLLLTNQWLLFFSFIVSNCPMCWVADWFQ